MPNPANPQSWNRYSYVLNQPVNFTDPTGHMFVEGTGGYGLPDVIEPPDENDDEGREPGEPRCKGKYCDEFEDLLTYTVGILDSIAWTVSAAEAIVADGAYLLATGVCIVSKGVGCGPAYEIAFAVDIGAARFAGIIEDTAGWGSFGLTFINDVSSGNIGYDKDIGPYVGKDSAVSLRNGIAGMIPESNIDFLVSHSQLKYDYDRLSGEKSGGFVPLFSLEFLGQLFLNDWW